MCLSCINNKTSCCSFYVFGCFNRVWKSGHIFSKYKNYTLVTTNWLSVTEYPFRKRRGSFPFYIYLFLSSITNNIQTELDYIRKRNCLPLASTWSHPRFVLVGPVLLISLDFCVVFFRLFVVVQCLVCPVLPMFLDCSFLITLRFPLMFSYMFTLKSFLVDILLHKMLSTEWALH